MKLVKRSFKVPTISVGSKVIHVDPKNKLPLDCLAKGYVDKKVVGIVKEVDGNGARFENIFGWTPLEYLEVVG